MTDGDIIFEVYKRGGVEEPLTLRMRSSRVISWFLQAGIGYKPVEIVLGLGN